MYGPEAERAIKAHAREGSTEAALRKFVILLVRLSFDRNDAPRPRSREDVQGQGNAVLRGRVALLLLLPELGRLHRDQLERPDRLVVFLPDAIHAEEHVAQWLQAPSSAGAGAGGSRGRVGHESGGAAEKREAQELYLLISVMGDGFLEEAH